MMRSVFDIGHSHFVVGCPSAKHNENFSERCKGQVQLEFGQFFNDLRELNRPRKAIDLYGQTTPLPSMLRIFSLDAILPLNHADLLRQRRNHAPIVPYFPPEAVAKTARHT